MPVNLIEGFRCVGLGVLYLVLCVFSGDFNDAGLQLMNKQSRWSCLYWLKFVAGGELTAVFPARRPGAPSWTSRPLTCLAHVTYETQFVVTHGLHDHITAPL